MLGWVYGAVRNATKPSTEPIFRAFGVLKRVSRPSTGSVGITPLEPHKTVPLLVAADWVESISERTCRYQIAGCFVGAAVTCAGM